MSESVQEVKVEERKEGTASTFDPRVIGFLQSFGVYPKAVRKAVITIEAGEDVKIECDWYLGETPFVVNEQKIADKVTLAECLKEIRNEQNASTNWR